MTKLTKAQRELLRRSTYFSPFAHSLSGVELHGREIVTARWLAARGLVHINVFGNAVVTDAGRAALEQMT